MSIEQTITDLRRRIDRLSAERAAALQQQQVVVEEAAAAGVVVAEGMTLEEALDSAIQQVNGEIADTEGSLARAAEKITEVLNGSA